MNKEPWQIWHMTRAGLAESSGFVSCHSTNDEVIGALRAYTAEDHDASVKYAAVRGDVGPEGPPSNEFIYDRREVQRRWGSEMRPGDIPAPR